MVYLPSKIRIHKPRGVENLPLVTRNAKPRKIPIKEVPLQTYARRENCSFSHIRL